VEKLFSLTFLGQVGLFLLFSTAMTGYGYLINDLADVELDRKHQKSNVFLHTNPAKARVIVMAVLCGGTLLAIPFLNRIWFVGLDLLWLAAATFYSLPPFRLKERGLVGLATTILAQQTIPTALLWVAFSSSLNWDALVFIAFATARGVSSDVGHQMRDWVHDVGTGTTTFAVQRGYAFIQMIYALCLEIERFALGVVIAWLAWNLPGFMLPGLGEIFPAWLLGLVYLSLFALTAGRSWRAWRNNNLPKHDPYDEKRQAQVRDALHLIHHSLPSVGIPLCLALWLTLAYSPNVIFLLTISLVYGLGSPRHWKAFWQILRGRATSQE
jgi:4-hydroxybenzoate polyprenyltransferase